MLAFDKESLLKQVLENLKDNDEMKRKWCGFCGAHGATSLKPEEQDEAFLLTFIDASQGDGIPAYTGEIPMEIGGPTPKPEPAAGSWGGGGEDWGKGKGKEGFKGLVEAIMAWKGWEKGGGGGSWGGGGGWDGGKKGGGKKGGGGSWGGGGGGKGGDPKKVFVGALPRSCSEAAIGNCLSAFGKVQSIQLKYGEDGQCKGYAFAFFEDVAGAQAAIEASKNGATLIEGKWIDCQAPEQSDKGKGKGGGWDDWGKGKGKGKDSGKGWGKDGGKGKGKGKGKGGGKGHEVFVGGLPKSADENALWSFFGQYGSVQKVQVKYDESGNPRGFCFVEFRDRESCDSLLAASQAGTTMLEGKWVNVQGADGGGKGKGGDKGKGKGYDDWDAKRPRTDSYGGGGGWDDKGKGKGKGKGYGKW